ncbi:Membrane-spanning 4-domains subfamily A member 6D [Dissostichus eleginoides]|uniref:Membrane-spanning 4-domains subfamily A member 6D n=1 Tax=Dissostichus eleginoides TaxID=100907 RepID=A0AAD9F6Y2_DISEL|nr:Membrane-spanning 4-domains subfamily A member 6D [Dissostichus eleginoides]
MSVELFRVSEPGGTNAGLQSTALGGSKPLHRFIKRQPKTVGIMVLVLGLSFFNVSIMTTPLYSRHEMWTAIPPDFMLGTLFVICGTLYIVTEHIPTKKTVTISLALSIVNILVACWTTLHIVPMIIDTYLYRHYQYSQENGTYSSSSFVVMGLSVEIIFLFYSIAGAVTLIVMSCLAVSALRSTKSEAIIVMTAAQAEAPVE